MTSSSSVKKKGEVFSPLSILQLISLFTVTAVTGLPSELATSQVMCTTVVQHAKQSTATLCFDLRELRHYSQNTHSLTVCYLRMD